MLRAWRRAGLEHPGDSRFMLAFTRDDVQALNTGARALRAAQEELKRNWQMHVEENSKAAGARWHTREA
jgi:hypothetical protein